MDEQKMLAGVMSHYFMPEEINSWLDEEEERRQYFTAPTDLFGKPETLDLNPSQYSGSMVVLDCTNMPARIREDLFMPSRDRLRVCAGKQAFEFVLEDYLGDHEQLQWLNRQRREEELRGRLADDRPLADALKNIIRSSPELRSLFRLGTCVPTAGAPGDLPEAFVGVKFPTYFRPVRLGEDGTATVIDCPVGGVGRCRCETDAENEYFTRVDRPGSVLVSPADCFEHLHLHDGQAMFVLKCPEERTVGAVVNIAVQVTDPSRSQPFAYQVRMRITECSASDPRPKPVPPPRSGALALPKVVEVSRDKWLDEEFGPESGLAMQKDIDGGLVAKVNIDNEHLLRTLERTKEEDRDVVRKQFVYGLVLAGVSLWSEYSDREEGDELVRSASKAYARVLLPTIEVLGALEQGLTLVS